MSKKKLATALDRAVSLQRLIYMCVGRVGLSDVDGVLAVLSALEMAWNIKHTGEATGPQAGRLLGRIAYAQAVSVLGGEAGIVAAVMRGFAAMSNDGVHSCERYPSGMMDNCAQNLLPVTFWLRASHYEGGLSAKNTKFATRAIRHAASSAGALCAYMRASPHELVARATEARLSEMSAGSPSEKALHTIWGELEGGKIQKETAERRARHIMLSGTAAR